jgi:hypothetical protein
MNWQDTLLSEVQKDEILGIPYAAQDARSYQTALTFDAYEVLYGLQGLIRDLDEQLKSPALMRLTRDRLKEYRSLTESHLKILGKLFQTLSYQST